MKKNNAILDSLTKRIEAIRSSHPELFDNISNSILQFSKDLQSIESFSENMKMSRKNLRKFDRTAKLQIGGGHRLLAGYINLDIFLPADIVWDVRSGIPFPDSRFDEIFCEHFFEHLDYPKSASNFLSEAYRTLNKGGVLKIVVPDCGAPITQYCKNNNRYFKKMVNFNYSKTALECRHPGRSDSGDPGSRLIIPSLDSGYFDDYFKIPE